MAELTLAAGRRVLVLVPEIALTPAVAAVFRHAFGGRVAIQHSGLSDGERHDQWHRIRDGAVDIVVGTRSAVFAPLDDVGLIIVDEEHDTSYKQEETPRYNGRDVAVVRGTCGGGARRARVGDAVDGELSECARRAVCAGDARAPRARPSAGGRVDRQHARRDGRTGRRRRAERDTRGRHRAAGSEGRAGAVAPESPWVRERGVLPRSAARRSTARTAACRSRCTRGRAGRDGRDATTATIRSCRRARVRTAERRTSNTSASGPSAWRRRSGA